MLKKVHDVNIKPLKMPAKGSTKLADIGKTPYHHGNLRQALVDAGLALLEAGQSGESGELSLRELARRVGVSANASYRHFPSKEALLVALAAAGFRSMAAAQAGAAQVERKPRQRHRAAGSAYIRFARENPALFRLMFGRFASSHRSGELDEAANLAYEALRTGVAQVLGLAPDTPEVTVAAGRSWGLVHGLSLLMLDGQFDKITDDPDALIDTIMRQAASESSRVKTSKKKK